MEPKDLVKVWDAPDHSRLTPKQISIRLPLVVSAKVNALAEMYPRKSKTEIIGDLLATALDQLEEGMPSEKGRLIERIPVDTCDDFIDGGWPQECNELTFEDVGLKGRFRHLVERHLRQLEEEASISDPWPVPGAYIQELEGGDL